jgi:hypothetical protein
VLRPTTATGRRAKPASAGLVLRWLALRRCGEWVGSIGELGCEFAALSERERHHCYVPLGCGLTKALQRLTAAIAAAGWRVEWRRTAAVRLIAFTRAAPTEARKQTTHGG